MVVGGGGRGIGVGFGRSEGPASGSGESSRPNMLSFFLSSAANLMSLRGSMV